MRRTEHAREIANRFADIVAEAGGNLSAAHLDELSLLIEAGIDAALVYYMEMTSRQLEQMAQKIRRSAEFFEEE